LFGLTVCFGFTTGIISVNLFIHFRKSRHLDGQDLVAAAAAAVVKMWTFVFWCIRARLVASLASQVSKSKSSVR